MYINFSGNIQKASQIPLVSPFLSFSTSGQGVFETMRTYVNSQKNTEIFHLDDHLDRLLDSANYLSIYVPNNLKSKLRSETQELLDKTLQDISTGILKSDERNFRIKISYNQDYYWITIDFLPELAENIYKSGIKITEEVFERNFPRAKYPSPAYKIFMDKQPKDCFETMFFSPDGFLREGNISNIFAVFDGTLYTPDKNILPGITRKTVLNIAKNLNIPIVLGEISREKLETADEIFLTNTTKSILSINEWENWTGNNFPIAKQLYRAFHTNHQK